MRRILLISFCLFISMAAQANTSLPTKTIGILVPIEVPAMQEIVAGFQSQLQKKYPGKIHYVIKNAEGDANLQQAILQQFKTQSLDLVAPIGTSATLAAMNALPHLPVLGVAADVPHSSLHNVTNVLDEVSITKQMLFIHQVLPALHRLTLVYSPSDTVFPEVKAATLAGKTQGILIEKLMIQQLSDLYSIGQQIHADNQAILMLKDLLVVSGTPTLAKVAATHQIPLIASDDGSVQKGAAFALGVSEREIGIESANLAAKILQGTKAYDIPTDFMQNYTVFINANAAKNQKVDLALIQVVAKQDHYPVVDLSKGAQ